jgi:hypothetical protein
MKSIANWDTATLAFAAEQSDAAVQLLTSEKITPLDALRLSYDKYIFSLLENTRFLPIGITAKLRTSQSKYVHAVERGISIDDARRLTSELVAILRQMTPLLSTE